MSILYAQRKIFLTITTIMVILIYQSSIPETGESQKGQIRLIVRADDIASFHAVNLACIKTYKEGIARSAEIMVPCAWFSEAVKMLNENPGFDVGVHLVLTSEWDNIKWRPLTHVPSLVDKDGHFYPNIWGDAKKLKHMQGFGKAVTTSDKIEELINNIKGLTPGTWVTVDHPGLEVAEMQTVNNNPDFNLGKERQAVTDVWTNEKIKKALTEKGVELIGYKDLIKY